MVNFLWTKRRPCKRARLYRVVKCLDSWVGLTLILAVPPSVWFCLSWFEIGRSGWAAGQDSGTLYRSKSTQPKLTEEMDHPVPHKLTTAGFTATARGPCSLWTISWRASLTRSRTWTTPTSSSHRITVTTWGSSGWPSTRDSCTSLTSGKTNLSSLWGGPSFAMFCRAFLTCSTCYCAALLVTRGLL